MKIRIFVSYCHDDISPDHDRLAVLINSLNSAGRGQYDILIDYKHREATIGSPLPGYFQQIDTADAVIILLTPSYKERIVRKGDTGVYQEFRRIYDRLLKAQADGTYNRTFLVFPIVFSGDFPLSCPEELGHLVCRNLTWLHVIPDAKKPTIRKDLRARLKLVIEEIADRIAAVGATKKNEYLKLQGELFRSFLFHETKSSWNKPESQQYLDSAFVKTSTFLHVRDRIASFVVGRKGSGKSTIAHVLPLLTSPKPTALLAIDFEQAPFDACYNILQEHPAEASDIRHLFSPIFSYQLIWDAFFHLFYAWVIIDRLPKSKQPSLLIRKLLTKSLARIRDESEKNTAATKILFVHAFDRLVNYLGRLMRQSATEDGVTSIIGEYSPGLFREFVFGRNGWEILERDLMGSSSINGRILVTADGFDTMAGYFTTTGADAVNKSRFARELLLALCQVTLNKGPARMGNSRLYELCDFCIAIPYDRFTDVREMDRDRYQFRNRFAHIEWSGIELSALVRKRLALLRDISDPSEPPLQERLSNVMQKGYPELPDEISFTFKHAPYRMPLFIYVLRHTFWRPRDVLFYYASLLAAADAFRKKKRGVMGSEFVRQVIAGATRSIITDEFIEEFKSSFPNLAEVINSFRLGPATLQWKDLQKCIDGIQFDTSLRSEKPSSLESKVELLYDLGFLGVCLDKPTSERLAAFRHAFVFNEQHLLTEKLRRDDYPNLQYVIHPVFCEYLYLDTLSNPELILAMDWDYLHRNEVLRGIVTA